MIILFFPLNSVKIWFEFFFFSLSHDFFFYLFCSIPILFCSRSVYVIFFIFNTSSFSLYIYSHFRWCEFLVHVVRNKNKKNDEDVRRWVGMSCWLHESILWRSFLPGFGRKTVSEQSTDIFNPLLVNFFSCIAAFSKR